MAEELSLREKKKLQMRANVLETAHELFHKQGFEETTIEEICAESEISKRTFFRYFRDKESLVFPNRDERLEAFTSFLAANKDSDNPFDTLRSATAVFGQLHRAKKHKILAQQALIKSSPALQAREREIDQDWEDAIAAAFRTRTSDSEQNALWARVRAGAVMGVVRATVTYWFETQCKDNLEELGMAAIERLERGFGIDELDS